VLPPTIPPESTSTALVLDPGGKYHVRSTPELVRVRDLPRRDWEEDSAEAVDLLTTWLQHSPQQCKPAPCSCCRRVRRLNPAQAAFLREAHDLRGRVICPFRTGAGKTLVTLLLGTVLARALGAPQKTLLVVPANTLEKTRREAKDYAKHWRCAAVSLVSYELLSHPKHADWLEKCAPSVIVCDEAHKMKNPSTKAWRRIGKYIKAHRSTIFIPCTASLAGRSIKEFWHYVLVAMRDGAPVPSAWAEANAWANAMDEKVPPEQRVGPGALAQLGPPPPPAEDKGPVHRTRRVFGNRLTDTPGVVSTNESLPPVTLLISSTALELPPELQAVVSGVRDSWTLPSGETFDHKWDLWRHSRTLGCGLYYHWDPPPPREWLDARREWHTFVREYLKTSRKWDSPVHVANLVDEGRLDDGGMLGRWREIRPTFEPVSVAEWVDDTAMRYAAQWLRDSPRGLCWVEYTPFGERLSDLTGIPYFSSGACDKSGRHIVDYPEGPAILSLSLREGHNLQTRNKNLILTCPPKGDRVDQLAGRTCREGQEEAEVSLEFLITTEESLLCLQQCFADARFAQAIDKQPRKLCYGQCLDDLTETMQRG